MSALQQRVSILDYRLHPSACSKINYPAACFLRYVRFKEISSLTYLNESASRTTVNCIELTVPIVVMFIINLNFYIIYTPILIILLALFSFFHFSILTMHHDGTTRYSMRGFVYVFFTTSDIFSFFTFFSFDVFMFFMSVLALYYGSQCILFQQFRKF